MKQPTIPFVPTECCGIRCTERSLCEIDSGKVMVTVAKPDIAKITLRYGTQAPHPVFQIVMGLVLTGLGYFPLVQLIHWMRYGGFFFTLESWIIPLPVFGVLAVLSAFKRGYFLIVDLQHGSKRLAFQRKPDPKDLDDFLVSVEQCYGVRISREVH